MGHQTAKNRRRRWRDPVTGIFWFGNSPEEGDPDCLCSFCLKVIPEFTEEMDYDPEFGNFRVRNVCIRLYRGQGAACLEARFHDECFRLLLARKVIQLNVPAPANPSTAPARPARTPVNRARPARGRPGP